MARDQAYLCEEPSLINVIKDPGQRPLVGPFEPLALIKDARNED